jgi:hypothetical protein
LVREAEEAARAKAKQDDLARAIADTKQQATTVQQLNDLANILPASLSTNAVINLLSFLKRPEPTGATIDEWSKTDK